MEDSKQDERFEGSVGKLLRKGCIFGKLALYKAKFPDSVGEVVVQSIVLVQTGFVGKWCRFLMGVLCLGMASGVQAASVVMESSIGFNETFQLNKWTPFSVVLENRGKSIFGTLEVIVRSGSEYKENLEETVYRHEVELPSNSKKKYDFTLFIRTSVHPLKINLWQNGQLLEHQSFSLKTHYRDKRMVLILGERGNSHFFGEVSAKARPLFIRPGLLPDTWFGYDGIESVVLQAEVLKNLRPAQFDALVRWVENGGFLVLSGGINYSFFSDSKMKNLLPIRVLGVERVAELRALQRFSGETFTSKNLFLVLRTQIDGGTTLLAENELPLIVEKGQGAGKIIFLAFDFQSSLFHDWKGNLNFWTWLKGFQPPEEVSLIQVSESAIFSALVHSISQSFPIYSLVLIFLLVYAVLIKFFFNRLQYREASKQPILLVSVLLVICFIGSWFYYEQIREDQVRYSRFSLLTKYANVPTVHAQEWLAVYSFLPGLFEMETEIRPIQLLEAGYTKEVAAEQFYLEKVRQSQIMTTPVRRWSHQFLKTRASIPFPLEGSFRQDGEKRTLVIENKTPSALKDGIIYFAQRLIPIGDVPADTRKTVELMNAQLEGYPLVNAENIDDMAEELLPTATSTYFGRFRKSLIEPIIYAMAKNYAPSQEHMLLLGWSDFSPRGIGDGANEDRISLLEWEIPLRTSSDAEEP